MMQSRPSLIEKSRRAVKQSFEVRLDPPDFPPGIAAIRSARPRHRANEGEPNSPIALMHNRNHRPAVDTNGITAIP
jgi:hypothetical protein